MTVAYCLSDRTCENEREVQAAFTPYERWEYEIRRKSGLGHEAAMKRVRSATATLMKLAHTTKPVAPGRRGAHGVGDDA